MTEPRQILPGTTYMVSRRTSHKRKLFDPGSEKIKEIFLYCFAFAVHQTGVELHAFSILPDGYFAVVSDPKAKLPKFMHLLNRNVAMAVNALRGTNENVFASGKYPADDMEDESEVVDAVVETMHSPVKMKHTRSLRRWNGLWSKAGNIGKKIKVKRPKTYFSKNGKMPAKLELVITPPPCCAHRSLKAYRKELAVRLVRKKGNPRRSTNDRETRQRIVARRVARARAYKQFCADYRKAIRLWRSLRRKARQGLDLEDAQAVFPCGTYWMERFCCVKCQV